MDPRFREDDEMGPRFREDDGDDEGWVGRFQQGKTYMTAMAH
jgi:hypothetical protein